MSEIILPEAKREIKPPELKEGITPIEYDGEDMDLPEFDPARQYGLWCPKGSPNADKMMAIAKEFIPVEYQDEIKIIDSEHGTCGASDPLNQRFTLGWKYIPVFRDTLINGKGN